MMMLRPSVAALVALACALCVPSGVRCQGTGLGSGGLGASAPGPSALPDIPIPTNLCSSQFCLGATTVACGGKCVLTAVGNQTQFCAKSCIDAWSGASTQSCLTGIAAGTYIQGVLTTLENTCNAGTIAAQRRAAAKAKYNDLFPCTASVNATILLGLDSCALGANATATNCGDTCQSSLNDISPSCRNTFPTIAPEWKPTIASCISNASAPEQPGFSGISPSSGDAIAPATETPSAAGPQALPGATTLLAALLAACVLLL